eukprot:COSAG05_NODE_1198_length_5555_cov_3.672287_2_plen_105_part_00
MYHPVCICICYRSTRTFGFRSGRPCPTRLLGLAVVVVRVAGGLIHLLLPAVRQPRPTTATATSPAADIDTTGTSTAASYSIPRHWIHVKLCVYVWVRFQIIVNV